MKIAISVESTNDLSRELLDKYDLKVIPYHIILGNEEITDGERSAEDIFAFVDKNKILPKTTAINRVEYEEYFSSLKKVLKSSQPEQSIFCFVKSLKKPIKSMSFY